MGSNDLTDDEIEALLKGDDPSGGQAGNNPKASKEKKPTGKKQVQKVAYGEVSKSDEIKLEGSNLNLLMDVPLDVSVEIGRTKKSVQEVLALNIGSVIELNKLSGEPVDLLVNGKVIAKAEVVIIDENFGIRITEIIKPKNRISFD